MTGKLTMRKGYALGSYDVVRDGEVVGEILKRESGMRYGRTLWIAWLTPAEGERTQLRGGWGDSGMRFVTRADAVAAIRDALDR